MIIMCIFVVVAMIYNEHRIENNPCEIYYINENQHTWTDYPGKIAIEKKVEQTLEGVREVFLYTNTGKFLQGIISQETNKITDAMCLYDVRVVMAKNNEVSIIRFQVETEVNVTDLKEWKHAMSGGKKYDGVYASYLKALEDFENKAILILNNSCAEVCTK